MAENNCNLNRILRSGLVILSTLFLKKRSAQNALNSSRTQMSLRQFTRASSCRNFQAILATKLFLVFLSAGRDISKRDHRRGSSSPRKAVRYPNSERRLAVSNATNPPKE